MSLDAVVSPESASVVVRNDRLKGRGLFAARAIAEDEVIEAAPVAIIDAGQAALLETTPLGHHYFHWDGDEDSSAWRGAVAFGLVSLVNHADAANAGVWPDHERQCMILAALRPIAEGEEITIHYDVDLWFEAH